MAHDRPNPAYELNDLQVNPSAEYGDMDGFQRMLAPGAPMAGPDSQNCFRHGLASPARRRFLGVRRPVTLRLGVCLCLPFGSGPSPRWGDRCIKEVLRVARSMRSSLRIIDFVGDPRLMEEDGSRGR